MQLINVTAIIHKKDSVKVSLNIFLYSLTFKILNIQNINKKNLVIFPYKCNTLNNTAENKHNINKTIIIQYIPTCSMSTIYSYFYLWHSYITYIGMPLVYYPKINS